MAKSKEPKKLKTVVNQIKYENKKKGAKTVKESGVTKAKAQPKNVNNEINQATASKVTELEAPKLRAEDIKLLEKMTAEVIPSTTGKREFKGKDTTKEQLDALKKQVGELEDQVDDL